MDRITDLPSHVPTIRDVAHTLKCSRSTIHELKSGDPRFPEKSDRGYDVLKIATLMELKETERTSDRDFEYEHAQSARQRLKMIDEGGFEFLTKAERKRFRKAVEETISTVAGARQRHIDELEDYLLGAE